MTGVAQASEGPGLYVHVPFCDRACPYCDFDFEAGRLAGRRGDRVAHYLAGLEGERLARPALEAPRFDSLYLGGGTPSALGPGQLDALLAWLGRSFDLSATRERTVELNPEHVDGERLEVLLAHDVGRVSLGVQSLDPGGLRQLGRGHDPARARAAVAACVGAGLRTSVDLIVGWPGHDLDILTREIDELVAAGVEHLSIYALTIEAGTPWPKLVRRGLRVLPDDDGQAELLLAAQTQLVARGFVHYEVASYARPGAEAIHNGKYWRWIDVFGLGPSAASVRHVGGNVERRLNQRGLAAWLDPDQRDAPERERLTGEAAAGEGLWLGLRRLQGLDIEAYLARFGVDRAWLEARIAGQIARGNLRIEDGGGLLRVAPDRWLWHDGIALDLL